MWRATPQGERHEKEVGFQSTPSVWRATALALVVAQHLEISIHALRVEGDFTGTLAKVRNKISIHALRVEGDDMQARKL